MKFNRLILFFLILCFIFPLMSNADQLEDAKAAIISKNYVEAHKILTPLAEENNAEAQTLLGSLYVNGQGVENDLKKGLSLIMKAANHGSKAARLIAFKLNMDLGNQGDTTAMYNAGYMCLNGWGGETENNTCLKWLENAAKMGHEKSAEILTRIYTKGMFGVSPDEEKAAYCRNLPAEFAKINKSAMLIIDVQKAFTGSDICQKQADNMITVINKLIGRFVKKDIDIVYIKQSTSGYARGSAYSAGDKLDSRLKIVGDKIFYKSLSSSFSSAGFIDYLKYSKVRHLYITGLAAEYCVSETVCSALGEGYAVTVISDALAAKNCIKLKKSLDKFKKLGANILLSEEL